MADSVEQLREECPFEAWKNVLKYGRMVELPSWKNGVEWVVAYCHAPSVDDDVFAWFKERGWLPYSFPPKDMSRPACGIVAPIVYSDVGTCVHTTPRILGSKILNGTAGLLSGRKARQSTTKREDASRFIHVSLNVEDAQKWGKEVHLLRKESSFEGWSILRVDLARASLKAFRDPASTTGYIVDGEYVPRNCVEWHSDFD